MAVVIAAHQHAHNTAFLQAEYLLHHVSQFRRVGEKQFFPRQHFDDAIEFTTLVTDSRQTRAIEHVLDLLTDDGNLGWALVVHTGGKQTGNATHSLVALLGAVSNANHIVISGTVHSALYRRLGDSDHAIGEFKRVVTVAVVAFAC